MLVSACMLQQWTCSSTSCAMHRSINMTAYTSPDSTVHGANMGPTWVLSAPDGPHVGPMDLVIWVPIYPKVRKNVSVLADFRALFQIGWNASTGQPWPWKSLYVWTLMVTVDICTWSWHFLDTVGSKSIWVRSWNCSCLVTWFCYQLIAKPGNKTATVPWPDPYPDSTTVTVCGHMHAYMAAWSINLAFHH